MRYACPASPVAPEDGTGVAPENRTGALCPLLYAFCALPYAPN